MDLVQLKERLQEIEHELIQIRRDLHAHPERGFEEYRTSQIIVKWLEDCGVMFRAGIAGTGVVGIIEGVNPGPTLGVRVDIDAVLVADKKEVPYASTVPGLAHACGHDVHTVIGLGLAKVLSERRDQLSGKVKLIFQASEELPRRASEHTYDVFTEPPVGIRGATLAIQEGVLENPKVDKLIGIHCWPGLRAGQIGYQYGATMAGTGNFHLAILGKGGHAATPHKTVDPMPIAGQIICALQTVVSRKVDPSYPLVLTIGTIKGGTRRSVITDRIDLTGTVRALDPVLLEQVVPEIMERLIKGIVEGNGASYVFEYGVDQPPVVNDDGLVRAAAASLKKTLGENAIELKEAPMTAEDFSFMARLVPAVYLKLGTSNQDERTHYPLHSPRFDVDESCIRWGILAITQFIYDLSEQSETEIG